MVPYELGTMMGIVCSLASDTSSYSKRKRPVEAKYWWKPRIYEARKACIVAGRAINELKGALTVITENVASTSWKRSKRAKTGAKRPS